MRTICGGPVILDARWLGRGGVGMTTELTLRALRLLSSEGSLDRAFVLRGNPELLTPMLWPGATIDADLSDPHARGGQSGWRRSDGRLQVDFHQMRPLTAGRRLQWLHDTIPLHFARNAAVQRAKRAYLLRVVSTSSALLVDSQHTMRCVVEELGADPDRIRQITFPIDLDLAAAVATRRAVLPPADRLLFIGRFLPHKNVPRLLEAFRNTDFARSGGELHLVGGSADEVRCVEASLGRGSGRVTIEGSVPRARIIDLLASSAGLIQPSLEEGFGLPVWEARTVGLPVIASTGGSLPELITDPSHLFDPLDMDAMSDAIDTMMATSSHRPNEPPLEGPTLAEFGARFLEGLEATVKHVGLGSTNPTQPLQQPARSRSCHSRPDGSSPMISATSLPQPCTKSSVKEVHTCHGNSRPADVQAVEQKAQLGD